jgi:hypothetical protein
VSSIGCVFLPPFHPRRHLILMLSSQKTFATFSTVWSLLIQEFWKAVACVLTGTTIKGKSKNVGDCPWTCIQKEKPRICNDKKSGTIERRLRLLDIDDLWFLVVIV